jgi:hypothetical protein
LVQSAVVAKLTGSVLGVFFGVGLGGIGHIAQGH